MHLKRWITALILIPLLILLLLKGSQAMFTGFVVLVTLLALGEYFTIVAGHLTETVSLWVRIPAFVAALSLILSTHWGAYELYPLIFGLNILALSIPLMLLYSPTSTVLEQISKQLMGLAYIPLLFSFLVLLRNSQHGALWILWIWMIISASDTGAFYTGTYWGKHALAPRLSPKKTFEGVLGGILAAVAVGLLFRFFVFPEISWSISIVFATVAAVTGMIGDLFESALKRSGKIKDSGWILPGHGGILDRLDGLMFVLPVAYIFKVYLI